MARASDLTAGGKVAVTDVVVVGMLWQEWQELLWQELLWQEML